jgi:hypothetical protein
MSASILCLAIYFKYRRSNRFEEYEFVSLSPVQNDFSLDEEDEFGDVPLNAEFKNDRSNNV